MKRIRIFAVALAFLVLVVGCSAESANSIEQSGRSNSTSLRRFVWVQTLKGHPTHQLTQIGFLAGCRKLGHEGLVVGTDSLDIAGTISLAEQVVASGQCDGIAAWAHSPGYKSFLEAASKMGIPVVAVHFPEERSAIPWAKAGIWCDPKEFATECAQAIGKEIGGRGTVAISQGSFNPIENDAARAFGRTMEQRFAQALILKPLEEGFDVPQAVSKVATLLQSNPEIVAAFSTTGGGAHIWATAAREVGRKMTIVGVNYTRANLDLIKSGEILAVVAQPLYEESFGAAELLDQLSQDKIVAWDNVLPAPLITRQNLDQFYELLDTIENGGAITP